MLQKVVPRRSSGLWYATLVTNKRSGTEPIASGQWTVTCSAQRQEDMLRESDCEVTLQEGIWDPVAVKECVAVGREML